MCAPRISLGCFESGSAKPRVPGSDRNRWNMILAKDNGVGKRLPQGAMELFVVEFMDVEWIRFLPRHTVVRPIWCRHQEQSRRCQHASGLHYQLGPRCDVLDYLEGDHEIQGSVRKRQCRAISLHEPHARMPGLAATDSLSGAVERKDRTSRKFQARGPVADTAAGIQDPPARCQQLGEAVSSDMLATQIWVARLGDEPLSGKLRHGFPKSIAQYQPPSWKGVPPGR